MRLYGNGSNSNSTTSSIKNKKTTAIAYWLFIWFAVSASLRNEYYRFQLTSYGYTYSLYTLVHHVYICIYINIRRRLTLRTSLVNFYVTTILSNSFFLTAIFIGFLFSVSRSPGASIHISVCRYCPTVWLLQCSTFITVGRDLNCINCYDSTLITMTSRIFFSFYFINNGIAVCQKLKIVLD